MKHHSECRVEDIEKYVDDDLAELRASARKFAQELSPDELIEYSKSFTLSK